jgi:hypothetical protein
VIVLSRATVMVVWLAPSESCTAVACAGADVGGGATVVDERGGTDVVGDGLVVDDASVVDDALVVVAGAANVVDAARWAELPHPARPARRAATARVNDAPAARLRMLVPVSASPTTGSPYGAGRPSRARDSTRASSA